MDYRYPINGKIFHLIVTLLVIIMVIFLQSYALARMGSSWFHIDLISILVIYTCIEHYLFFAFIKLFCAAILMQVHSATPDGFYLMYFLLVLVGANFLSRILLLSKTTGQFFIFSFLFLMKFFLIYLMFVIKGNDISLFSYIGAVWKGALVTLILFIPIAKFLSVIDSYFEYLPAFDKK